MNGRLCRHCWRALHLVPPGECAPPGVCSWACFRAWLRHKRPPEKPVENKPPPQGKPLRPG